MGPFAGPSLSAVTIGAMQDLGYVVDFSQAESLDGDDLDDSCRCDLPGGREQDVEPLPQLSEAGLAAAVEFGLKVLDQREVEMSQNLMPLADGYIDISAEVISVMYMEDGEIFDVIVKSSMRD